MLSVFGALALGPCMGLAVAITILEFGPVDPGGNNAIPALVLGVVACIVTWLATGLVWLIL